MNIRQTLFFCVFSIPSKCVSFATMHTIIFRRNKVFPALILGISLACIILEFYGLIGGGGAILLFALLTIFSIYELLTPFATVKNSTVSLNRILGAHKIFTINDIETRAKRGSHLILSLKGTKRKIRISLRSIHPADRDLFLDALQAKVQNK